MKITKRVIDAAAYAGANNSKDVRWDDQLPGFGVRVYPSGRKTFVLFYRVAGRQRFMAVGDCGVLTLDQARDLAKKHLVGVNTGEDPLGDRERAVRGETVKELGTAYLERHAVPHKRSSRDDKRRIEQHIVPAWGSLKASAVKHADVAALHSKVGAETPYEANRLAALISKMFTLARRWGFVPEDHVNPARDIQKFKEEKRDRWVTPDELPRLAQAIDTEKNVYVRAALWLYLLTGLRKNELLAARWSDVDLTRSELRIGETKNGRVHYAALSTTAVKMIERIPHDAGNPFIFPGRVKGEHLVNISKPWESIRETAGVDDVRLHDLRRTVGSWLAQSGNTLHLIGRVLNHSSERTTAIYARFAEENVRTALDQHGKKLLAAAKRKRRKTRKS